MIKIYKVDSFENLNIYLTLCMSEGLSGIVENL